MYCRQTLVGQVGLLKSDRVEGPESYARYLFERGLCLMCSVVTYNSVFREHGEKQRRAGQEEEEQAEDEKETEEEKEEETTTTLKARTPRKRSSVSFPSESFWYSGALSLGRWRAFAGALFLFIARCGASGSGGGDTALLGKHCPAPSHSGSETRQQVYARPRFSKVFFSSVRGGGGGVRRNPHASFGAP